MKPSEKLMLLLELNGYDITQFKLKKQLEYEKTGNNDLFKHDTYAELIVSHYQFEEKHDYFHRNPLMYNDSWASDVTSIDQFFFQHPELYSEMTIRDLHNIDQMDKKRRQEIINDVLNDWMKEYETATEKQLNSLKQSITLLPKKSKQYGKPGKISVFILVITLILMAMLYRTPNIFNIPMIPGVYSFVESFNKLLYEEDLFSLVGFITMMFTAFYIIFNNALTMYIRDVSGENNKAARRIFKKWKKDMIKARKLQAKALKDYAVTAAKGKTKLSLKAITAPERKLGKYKWYVAMVNGRYDWMKKHYKTLMRWLRRVLFLALLMNVGFVVFGYGLLGGLIDV